MVPKKRLCLLCRATPPPAETLLLLVSQEFYIPCSARTFQRSRPKRPPHGPDDDTAGKSKHHPGGCHGSPPLPPSLPSKSRGWNKCIVFLLLNTYHKPRGCVCVCVCVKANRNTQRVAASTASSDAAGVGATRGSVTSTAGNSPESGDSKKFPFSAQMVTARKITCLPPKKEQEESGGTF